MLYRWVRKERSDGIAIVGSPFGEADRVTRNLAPTARKQKIARAFLLGRLGRGDAMRKERSDGIAIADSPFGEADRVTRNLAPTGALNATKKRLDFSSRFGRGDAIRTRNLRFWRPLLYR